MNKLEDLLGLSFENELLLKALTHSSYANESKVGDNERLEFLGDAVLELCMSEYLYLNCPNLTEGEMTKRRAQLVREEALVYYAKKINLPMFIRLGHGEEQSGGREKPAIIADAFEAILGATYLSFGFLAAKELVEKIIIPYINDSEIIREIIDYKSDLQEKVQSEKRSLDYKLISKDGPDHNPKFKVHVLLDGIVMGEGIGKSKKDAEQNAAKAALEKLCLK